MIVSTSNMMIFPQVIPDAIGHYSLLILHHDMMSHCKSISKFILSLWGIWVVSFSFCLKSKVLMHIHVYICLLTHVYKNFSKGLRSEFASDTTIIVSSVNPNCQIHCHFYLFHFLIHFHSF